MRVRALLASLLLFGACAKDSTLLIHLVTPVGDDPVRDAASLRLTFGVNTQTVGVQDGQFDLSIKVNVSQGPVSVLVVEALTTDGRVVGRGTTPPFQFLPADSDVWIYLSRPGTSAVPAGPEGMPLVLNPARSRHAAVPIGGLGIYLAGGRGADGAPLAGISVVSGYTIDERTFDVWKLTAPRMELSAAFNADGFIDFVGGAEMGSAASSLGERFDPTGRVLNPVIEVVQDAGQAPLARAAAASAVGSEGLLLFGGRGSDGMPAAGALLFTESRGTESVTWADAVPRIGATATPILGGSQIVIFGGGPIGSRTVERYISRTSAQVFDPTTPVTNRKDHSATLLDDGRLLILGGADDVGAPLRSALLYDPTRNTAEERADFLAQARTLHTTTRVGNEIVVLGGQNLGGLVPTVEVYDAMTLARVREVPMIAPRVHHTANDPGNGNVYVLGGEDLGGAPIATVEIYQPGT